MGIPGSPNALLMRRAAAAADADPYLIEQSLIFNPDDNPSLSRTFSIGDRRTWTFSCWAKRCSTGSVHRIMSSGADANNYFLFEFSDDDYVKVLSKSGGTNKIRAYTSGVGAVYRDPSAWYSLVLAIDTTQATAADRIKLYINGEDVALTLETTPDHHLETEWLDPANTHKIGQNGWDAGGDFDGYLADVRFIEGVQLSGAAFGSYDSSGVFNPKEFSLPTPNTNKTWSGMVTAGTGGFRSGFAATRLFDGAKNTASQDNSNSIGNSITFTPTGGIAFSTSIDVYCYGNITHKYSWELTDGRKGESYESGETWHKAIKRESGTLKWLKIEGIAASTYIEPSVIRVDGIELIDGQTDKTWTETKAANPNNGIPWENHLTISSGGWDGISGPQYAFGYNGTAWTANTGATITFTPPGGIAYSSKVEVMTASFGDQNFAINGGSATTVSPSTSTWTTIATGSGTINTMTVVSDGGSNDASIHRIAVDGIDLLPGGVNAKRGGNSFQLKFADKSLTRYLGKDTFNGKITDATGGLPIYNTSDDYGDVKGSGYRADSSAGTTDGTGLVFALPGDVLTDEHDEIVTASTAHTVTNVSSGVTISTDESRFYGSSLKFDSGDRLTVAASDDFEFGTGDVTVEGWFNCAKPSSGTITIIQTGVEVNWSPLIELGARSDGKMNWAVVKSGTSSNLLGAGNISYEPNEWNHFAVVKNGETVTCYLNGTEDKKATNVDAAISNGVGNSNNRPIIGSRTNGSATTYASPFVGYIQDIRIYKGIVKYTANFSPPNRKDWTLNNLSEEGGIAYSSYWGGTGTSSGADVENRGNSFDGNDSTYTNNAQSNTIVYWVPPSGIAYNDLEVKFGAISNGNNQVYINESMQNVTNAGGQTYTDSNGTLTSVAVKDVGSSHGRIFYIKINGSYLLDGNAYTQDVHTDTPTNYVPDGGNESTGGVTRGNYCTLNPFQTADNSGSNTLDQGNLYAEGTSSSGAWHKVRSTMAIPKGDSGKWYYEAEIIIKGSGIGYDIGWDDPFNHELFAGGMGDNSGSWCMKDGGQKRHGGTTAAYGDGMVTGTVIGVGYDNGSIYFWKDGTIQNSGTAAYTSVSATLCPTVSLYTESNAVAKLSVNFGQRAFKHAQSGYHGYCAQNLPDLFGANSNAAEDKNTPSKYFDILTYKGTGTTTQNVLGLGFQPDLVWIKNRSAVGTHNVFDAVRGNTKRIFPDLDQAENTNANIFDFKATGIEVTEDAGVTHDTNDEGALYVAFNWDAGTGSASTNNSGSNNATIACNYLVNQTAGFSIATYTGTDDGSGTNNVEYVYHGLGTAPDFVVIKSRDGGYWMIKHKNLTSTKNIILHDTHVETQWGSGYIGDLGGTNSNNIVPLHQKDSYDPTNHMGDGEDYVMYSWFAVPQFSAFGTYEGVGATNGPFCYTGMTPSWILFKNIESTQHWQLVENVTDTLNPGTNAFYANLNNAMETNSAFAVDFLSNGFKIRNTNSTMNTSGHTYVYAAFTGTNPFKTARAR